MKHTLTQLIYLIRIRCYFFLLFKEVWIVQLKHFRFPLKKHFKDFILNLHTCNFFGSTLSFPFLYIKCREYVEETFRELILLSQNYFWSLPCKCIYQNIFLFFFRSVFSHIGTHPSPLWFFFFSFNFVAKQWNHDYYVKNSSRFCCVIIYVTQPNHIFFLKNTH